MSKLRAGITNATTWISDKSSSTKLCLNDYVLKHSRVSGCSGKLKWTPAFKAMKTTSLRSWGRRVLGGHLDSFYKGGRRYINLDKLETWIGALACNE